MSFSNDDTQPMYTLEGPSSFEEIIKKSRFVATAGPIASDEAAKDFIAAHSDGDATTTAGLGGWVRAIAAAMTVSPAAQPASRSCRRLIDSRSTEWLLS